MCLSSVFLNMIKKQLTWESQRSSQISFATQAQNKNDQFLRLITTVQGKKTRALPKRQIKYTLIYKKLSW